ncbi:MAG: cobalamin-dependent protein, partial [Desulfovibrionaceae bacterium]|nr:cobalamin-dependent protein [Desulfovibrionaceae bacterium]
MKILLVNAPTTYAAVTTADWDTTAEDIGAFPPIGLSYLAGYLCTHTTHEVIILDTLALRLKYPEIERRILEIKPDLVGVTAFTPTFYDVLEVCKLVKKNLPHCQVCLGGSHVDTFTQETMSHSEIDFCVHGEGEAIFAELLNAIENNLPLSDVKGVSYRQDGQVVTTGQAGYQKDLDSLPLPAFHLLPLDKYKSAIGTGNVVGIIASSRGCPYHCTYCNRPYQTYRQYGVDRIISEMRIHYDRGVREFLFFDDMFNINPKRVIDISMAIKTNFPGITWSFRGRVDQVTDNMVKIAMESGLRQILFGVEAGSDEDLKAIKKHITTKQVVDAIATCKKFGLE